MEIGIAILLFVCMTALLYVLLSLKITRQVDLQIKEFYKTRIHADMQEFYREMEGYAALFENRIQRFRALVDRNEEILRAADARATAPVAEPQAIAEPPVLREREIRSKTKSAKAAKVKPQPKGKVMPAKTTAAKKTAPLPAAKSMAVRDTPSLEPVRARELPVERMASPVREMASARFVPEADVAEDSAIAEELMKDLFPKDEMELSKKTMPAPQKPVAVAGEMRESSGTVRQGSPQVANFFSRLGKAIEPVLFGEKAKPAGDELRSAVPLRSEMARTAPAAVSAAKPTSDFSEVLRRAEQIKAEKQAERERAEVEAKAEFYAGGDTFQSARAAVQAENIAARLQPAPQSTLPPNPPRAAARDNTLAVKELDRHTVNFLIDSLVKDNGYRRQALRALTENNIPLDEIARLSKIDIGELELMRQLGRF